MTVLRGLASYYVAPLVSDGPGGGPGIAPGPGEMINTSQFIERGHLWKNTGGAGPSLAYMQNKTVFYI